MPGKALGVMMSDTTGMIDVLATNSGGTIGFYGVTPITRAAAVTTVTTTGASSTTNAYGYTTAAQADDIVTAVNAIISRLSTIGLTS